MVMRATAQCQWGCPNTARESVLKDDSGRKIPSRTRDSNLHQYCAWLWIWSAALPAKLCCSMSISCQEQNASSHSCIRFCVFSGPATHPVSGYRGRRAARPTNCHLPSACGSGPRQRQSDTHLPQPLETAWPTTEQRDVCKRWNTTRLTGVEPTE